MLSIVLSSFYVLTCLFLLVVVLLQQGKGGDIASAFGGSGSSHSAFGARAGATILTRATTVLGALFIFTILAFVYNILTTFKVLESFDGNDWPIKHAIRPLIPMIVILIRSFTL